MPVRKNNYTHGPPPYPTFQRDRDPTVLDVAARQLTDHEFSIFQEGLYDYEKRHNLEAFVKSLDYSLSTTQKRQLIFPILNNVVRPSDKAKFSQLLIRYGLAVPATPEHRKASSPPRRTQESLSPPRSPPRKPEAKKVKVKRDTNGEWGFDIRGGVEHGVGVFVSWVDPDSTADRAGVKPGDQILRANGVNFETITHYDAVEVIRSANKLQMTLLPLGKLPMDYDLNPQMYRWTDSRGRPCSPPPHRHLSVPRSPSGQVDPRIYQEPDVRKVNLFSQLGEGYGLSIRGGVEHGLGIYVSYIEDGSVAAINGIKIGDQILEVNNISFLSVTHEEAAKILKSSQMLVMTVRSVGKLPHSKLSQFSQTQWQRTSPERRAYEEEVHSYRPKGYGQSMFARGVGTQVMHKKQKVGATSSHHMMMELARNVLDGGELKTFSYYLNQYENERIGVEDLVTALLRLLDTDEKKGLLSEVRPVIAARDLDRFNELTVHAEIAARRRIQSESSESVSGSSVSSGPPEDIIPGLSENFSFKSKGAKLHGAYSVQDAKNTGSDTNLRGNLLPRANISSNNNNTGLSDESTLTPGRMEVVDSAVKKTKNNEKPSGSPIFRAPPPPSTPPTQPKHTSVTTKSTNKGGRSTSTPQGSEMPDPQAVLESTLKERRKRVNPGSFVNRKGGEDIDGYEDTWDERWEDTTLSSIHTSEHHQHSMQSQRMYDNEIPGRGTPNSNGMSEDDIRRIQEQAKQEAEDRARREYEELLRREKEKLLQQQEESRKRWEEEERLRRAQELARIEEEEQVRLATEERIRREAEEAVKRQYEDKLKREAEERARLAAENEARRKKEERLAEQLKAKEEMEAQRKREQDKLQELAQMHAQEKEEQARAEHEKLQRAKVEQERLRQNQKEQERLRREQEEQERLRREQEEQERLRREQEEQQKAEREKLRKKEEREHQKSLEEEIRQEEEERRRESEEQIKQKEEEDRQRKLAALQQKKEAQERKQKEEQEQIRKAEEKKQKDLERKQREEELKRKQEQERKRREEEAQKEEEMKVQREKERREKAEEEERKWREEQERKHRENTEHREDEKRKLQAKLAGDMAIRQEKVKFGDSPKMATKKVLTADEDRERAQDLLNRRMEKVKEKAKIVSPIPVNEGGKSYKEFRGLLGDILTVEIKKTTNRLGIAIEGGTNTKLKILKIREVTPGCCAALTGTGLSVGQQILAVDDISLYAKKHKDAALAIKGAFDSDKPVMKLTVLDPEES